MVARIEIELREPSKRGKFDGVIIHLYKGNEHYSTNINFDFNPLFSFARDKESIVFDFLFFSVLVYNIDRFINRHIFSLEGWTRVIEVTNLPVIHVGIFQQVKTQMDNAVSFLTGDIWNINYSQSEGILYREREDIRNWGDISVYEKVSLFSGGLDSLIGAIDELEMIPQNKKLLLISHKDLGKEGVDQNSIMSIFGRQHLYDNKYAQIQTSVGIGKRNLGERIAKESTFRSRSLLFIGMGIYAANKIGRNIPLIIPENGTIALNIPLVPSRRSACSTRTTHPTFMYRLQNILGEIGIATPMHNPYEFKTKGEMVTESRNTEVLLQLIDASCSCAKRSHTHYWDNRGNNIKHCGMCLPCIYRRVSLYLNDLDDARHYGTDVFNGGRFDINNLNQKSPRDFRTLLDFIRRRPSLERIEKELLINGIQDVSRIREYAAVVDRTIEQIIMWIRASGNNEIKRKAGII
ncbi:MAG: Qat anti-phage system QueC-like protein QatC [Proteiniphilum sp.]|jgi:7-cyano-7-deazaguanine synthase in queuosine biosynthesis|uniref:Qat anti-phage system QueC-like protein QatC n=1 Tax=Proteiniphilum sp. TaxID=1926877 RepID=UPI002B2152EC|nr:Qat anti-phage system QueC-like protein QatC [Proteiniphilum sp.]MEA5126909.1 Qat anti-phage system QueC-like protein QatC [Proteiniphilum sp.]